MAALKGERGRCTGRGINRRSLLSWWQRAPSTEGAVRRETPNLPGQGTLCSQMLLFAVLTPAILGEITAQTQLLGLLWCLWVFNCLGKAGPFDVFSKREALRTVFELPVLLMEMEVITGTAGTHLKPLQKERENVLATAFSGSWIFTALSEATRGA